MVKTDRIQTIELRRLLHSLKDTRPDIWIRFRLLGEMWQDTHMQIVRLTEHGATFADRQAGKLVIIHDLRQVVQFELDHAFQQYHPHFHYQVDPVLN